MPFPRDGVKPSDTRGEFIRSLNRVLQSQNNEDILRQIDVRLLLPNVATNSRIAEFDPLIFAGSCGAGLVPSCLRP